MAYNFQQPIFLVPRPGMPLTVQTPPAMLVAPAPTQTVASIATFPVFTFTWKAAVPVTELWAGPLVPRQDLSKIMIKVIFYGNQARAGKPGGFWTASTDAFYENPPDRNTVLGNLSYWSRQEGLVDRVYAGQAKLILTSNSQSVLTILPGTGPQTPWDLVKTIELKDNPPRPQFEIQMADIRARRLGAFLVVDADAYDKFASPPPPPVESNPPPPPDDDDDDEVNSQRDDSNSGSSKSPQDDGGNKQDSPVASRSNPPELANPGEDNPPDA